MYSLFMQSTDQVNQLLDISPKSIKFPYNESVPLSQNIQNFAKFRPFGTTPTDIVIKDLLTAGLG